MHKILKRKHVGILLPIFSMRSERDWGIGDITSMHGWLEVLKAAELDILQILPINEMPPGVNCPYTALSAFAIDPVYIDPEAVEELKESPEALEFLASKEFRERLHHVRSAKTILYDDIRGLKHETLWKIYAAFDRNHIKRGTKEGKDFLAFCEKNAYWLEDYALFRRLKDVNRWISWTHWDQALGERRPEALEKARAENALEINYFKYLQWLIRRQWAPMRWRAGELGIKLFGDLPFMVNQEAADVWSRQNEFDISNSIGAPPDAFTPEGQKWGLPAYRWEETEKNNFEWWRLKLKSSEDLYDIYRIDHMVGFFRTWIVPEDKKLKPHFDVEGEENQEDRGRRFLKALVASSPMLPIGEDLGLIPPFVRKVLAEQGVPGYKVMRWETKEDGTYIDPADYPAVSLATTSTHDTETLAEWWASVAYAEKKKFWEMVAGENRPPAFAKALDRITEKAVSSGSRVVLLTFPDIFGTKDRINTPNTLGPHNWSFRSPVPLEKFVQKHAATLEKLARWIREAR
ncbi:MAG: 4-alpha-glucanotransferase [Elusimicrobiales bacterium]|nr:4-alpha-glucanotransferase [Elusimicrobiales bacterium]